MGVVIKSCSIKKEILGQNSYSFFIAGHVYGNPKSENLGVYPTFLEKIKETSSQYRFGFFTGDIVRKSTKESWLKVHDDINRMNVPVYFAPGNHDMGDRALYQEMNGVADTFFVAGKDVFLLFDNTKYGWNMNENQLLVFQQALKQLSGKSRLFVFGHNVLWEDQYACAQPNSIEGKGPDNLFWTTTLPLLKELKNEVYWFAGDVGATITSQNVSYAHQENVHLIASGMGNQLFDNYLQVEVQEEKVTIKVVPLMTSEVKSIHEFKCK